MIYTDYLSEGLDFRLRQKAIKKVCKHLSKFPRNVGLVFTGLSGMLIGISVADKTKRPFAVVRKKQDNSHSCSKIEGHHFNKYIIIDDFIDTGTSIKRIIKEMNSHNFDSRCIGIILYANAGGEPTEFKGINIYR